MAGRTDEEVMDGQKNGSLDGAVGGWTDEWMDERMDGLKFSPSCCL